MEGILFVRVFIIQNSGQVSRLHWYRRIIYVPAIACIFWDHHYYHQLNVHFSKINQGFGRLLPKIITYKVDIRQPTFDGEDDDC